MILQTVFIWSKSSGGWLVESAVGYKVWQPAFSVSGRTKASLPEVL